MTGLTALLYASVAGCTDIVRIFLEARADVNEKGSEGTAALDAAVGEGYTEIVELLKKAGAKE